MSAFLYWSYKATKTIIAPPVLFNIGFTCAAFVCCLYYKEWRMYMFSFTTFFIFVIGNLIFTTICIVLNQKRRRNDVGIIKLDSLYKLHKINILLFISIFVHIFVAMMKIKYYKATFGSSLSISELIFAFRINALSSFDDKIAVTPSWLDNLDLACGAFYFIEIYFLSLYFILGYKSKKLLVLLIANIVLYNATELLTGARGHTIASLGCLLFLYTMKYLQINNKNDISRKVKIRILISFLIIISSFKVFGELLGREARSDINSSYNFAIYCGAQFKNMDSFVKHPVESPYLGWTTLNRIFSRFEIPSAENENILNYNRVGNYTLGNVYTTYYNFYYDGKMFGVVFFTLIMALVSIIIYNKSQNSRNYYRQRLSEVIYIKIAWALSMCFFANRFYDEIIWFTFFKQIVYWCIFNWCINKYFTREQLNTK